MVEQIPLHLTLWSPDLIAADLRKGYTRIKCLGSTYHELQASAVAAFATVYMRENSVSIT
jgi:hypothetical protein